MNDKPTPSPNDVAKQASLVNLAQYTLAINGQNILGEEAKQTFSLLQQVCSLIILDTLRDYTYKNVEDQPPARRGKK